MGDVLHCVSPADENNKNGFSIERCHVGRSDRWLFFYCAALPSRRAKLSTRVSSRDKRERKSYRVEIRNPSRFANMLSSDGDKWTSRSLRVNDCQTFESTNHFLGKSSTLFFPDSRRKLQTPVITIVGVISKFGRKEIYSIMETMIFTEMNQSLTLSERLPNYFLRKSSTLFFLDSRRNRRKL